MDRAGVTRGPSPDVGGRRTETPPTWKDQGNDPRRVEGWSFVTVQGTGVEISRQKTT